MALFLQYLLATVIPLAIARLPNHEGVTEIKRDYTGYKLIRFKIEPNHEAMKKLDEIEYAIDESSKNSRLIADVWAEPTAQNPFAEVLVAPEFLIKFLDLVKQWGIDGLTVLEHDIQEKINRERREIAYDSRRRKRSLRNWSDFNIHTYHTYSEMEQFMRVLSEQVPDMVELVNVSTSYEGRTIWGVKISSPDHPSTPDKPSILVDAGVHAREWIAPAVALYMIKKLIADHSTNPRIRQNLRKFDWYIIPQVNPDGYEYSRTTDRLWRKTRSVNTTVNKWCTGADANRNWGYRWGEAGANRSPCSNIYAGSHPYSEPEIMGLKNFFTWHVANPQVYVSLHSYGQLFLSPWGYTNQRTDNYLDQQMAAQQAVNAMRNKTGASYHFGTISELMYTASGTSIDFMQHRGVPYIYGVELRPQDTQNSYAFSLPPEFIATTGDEMLAALLAIGDYAVKTKRL